MQGRSRRPAENRTHAVHQLDRLQIGRGARHHRRQHQPARAARTIGPEHEALIAGLIDIDPEAGFHGATSLVSMSRLATRTWPVISWCRVVWNRASRAARLARSEEHTSELQSLMRISYAVFCLQKQQQHNVRDKIANQHTDTKT